jgi:dolichyl-phosphate-mannose--protein O-mannosyl transferase
MTSEAPDAQQQEKPAHKTDPIATLLFLTFAGALMYLLVGSSVGLYPWFLVLDQVYFVPTWEAAITFLAIAIIMFVTLIGGLVKMRYSIILVGVVVVIAVFVLAFFVMLFVAGFSTPLPP